MKKEMILAIVALVIAITAVVIAVAVHGPQGSQGERGLQGQEGPQGSPGTFEGEWYDFKYWEGEEDFTSSWFHVDGYVLRIDWSVLGDSDYSFFLLYLEDSSWEKQWWHGVTQTDFKDHRHHEGIGYAFVEPGDYKIHVNAGMLNSWQVDIDVFY